MKTSAQELSVHVEQPIHPKLEVIASLGAAITIFCGVNAGINFYESNKAEANVQADLAYGSPGAIVDAQYEQKRAMDAIRTAERWVVGGIPIVIGSSLLFQTAYPRRRNLD